MQIAVMLAVLISKIARFDYPKEWYLVHPQSLCNHLFFDKITTA